MAGRKRHKVSEQVRAAVVRCGLGNNELARRAGIDKTALSRFMSGERGLSMEVLDAVGEVIGLKVSIPKRPRK